MGCGDVVRYQQPPEPALCPWISIRSDISSFTAEAMRTLTWYEFEPQCTEAVIGNTDSNLALQSPYLGAASVLTELRHPRVKRMVGA